MATARSALAVARVRHAARQRGDRQVFGALAVQNEVARR
jgi:hypothetical protein